MPANYVLLERIELNADTSSITFSNIPQSGYTDLKIVVSARSSTGIYQTDCNIQVGNGSVDTGSNYQTKELYGDGTSAASNSFTTTNIHPPIAGAGATSNTFGNFEIYIPNYTSSSQKSISCDVVTEHNSANAAARISAHLWTGTSAINIITLTAAGTSFVQYSTFSLYGLAAVGTTPAIAPKASGGNIVTTDGTYWYHTFLASGTFTPAATLSCDYLVVAGGGGGGWAHAAGGGAGGLRSATAQSLTTTSYSVTIGAGGTTGTGYASSKGTNGVDSTFNSLTSTGGGAGGGSANGAYSNGNAGGSGGGGSYSLSSGYGYAGAGNTPSTSPSQGNNGGQGSTAPASGGGGGGAGAVGTAGAPGAGGIGSSSFSSWGSATNTGQNVSGTYYYAGGGGGGVENATGAAGGYGGGGSGVGNTGSTGGSGTANTGGGGGGGGYSTYPGGPGGSGGSGIVIIRYTMA